MADKSERSSYFPLIEKRYEQPMKYWFSVMEKLKDKKYPEQIRYLKENYGFSQAHANALVMYSRGSKSSKRFAKPDEFFKKIDKQQAKTMKAIFKVLQKKYPKLELVIAWNKPMVKLGETYIFGASNTKNYILIAPWDTKVLKRLAPKLKEYEVLKKTVRVPNDWKVDSKLLIEMVKDQIKRNQ